MPVSYDSAQANQVWKPGKWRLNADECMQQNSHLNWTTLIESVKSWLASTFQKQTKQLHQWKLTTTHTHMHTHTEVSHCSTKSDDHFTFGYNSGCLQSSDQRLFLTFNPNVTGRNKQNTKLCLFVYVNLHIFKCLLPLSGQRREWAEQVILFLWNRPTLFTHRTVAPWRLVNVQYMWNYAQSVFVYVWMKKSTVRLWRLCPKVAVKCVVDRFTF